jgi:hypothetical protein
MFNFKALQNQEIYAALISEVSSYIPIAQASY